jgi:hypothetical protein
MESVLP